MVIFFVYCLCCMWLFFFFFSSRRRHTRCLSDWSSDVCSSDLQHDEHEPVFEIRAIAGGAQGTPDHDEAVRATSRPTHRERRTGAAEPVPGGGRSEERRVGKECRAGWTADRGRRSKSDEDEERR